jgi:ATP-binding cassette subfamily F protein uup
LETSTKKHSYKTQRELDELELEIPKLEKQKQELELQLASGITDYNQIQELSNVAKRINELLDQKSTRWLEIQEEI